MGSSGIFTARLYKKAVTSESFIPCLRSSFIKGNHMYIGPEEITPEVSVIIQLLILALSPMCFMSAWGVTNKLNKNMITKTNNNVGIICVNVLTKKLRVLKNSVEL